MEEDAFGISSAPEQMNEVVDGLSDVKIIANDFLFSEFSSSKEKGMHANP